MIPQELQEVGISIDEQGSWKSCLQIDGTWLFDWSGEAGDGDEIVVVSRAARREEKEDPRLAPQLAEAK